MTWDKREPEWKVKTNAEGTTLGTFTYIFFFENKEMILRVLDIIRGTADGHGTIGVI